MEQLYKISHLIFIICLLNNSCKKDSSTELTQGNTIDNKLVSDGDSSSFQRIIGGIKLDALYSGDQTADGGYIFCGFTENQSLFERDILILKTNIKGETEWIKIYSGNTASQGWYIEQTFDKGFIIAASASLLKINNDGLLQWQRTYDFEGYIHFSTVRQTIDSGFVVTISELLTPQANLLKTDKDGNELWRKTFTDNKEFNYIDLINDGGFIICGTSYHDYMNQSDIYIVRVNELGDTLWTRTFGNSYDNMATTIIQSTSGFVICGYNINTPSGSSGFVLMLDTMGNETWTKEYQIYNIEALDFITKTNSEEFVAVGRESFGSTSKCYLIKINSTNGNVIWQKTFNAGDYNIFNEVHQTTDYGFIVTGYTKKTDNGNGYIIKTDNNGN